MKMLFDFFPIALFYIAYKFFNIFVATGVLIVATTFQVAYLWIRYRRVEPMYLITFILVLVFGGLTIGLHDVMFLKWKVSIVNWLFGAAFLILPLFSKKTLIEHLTGKNMQLPHAVWLRLNLMWGIFFLVLGAINIIVVYAFSTAIWVDFKVFGMLGLTILFVILQTMYLYKHIKEDQHPKSRKK